MKGLTWGTFKTLAWQQCRRDRFGDHGENYETDPLYLPLGTTRRSGGPRPAVGWTEPRVIWHKLEHLESGA